MNIQNILNRAGDAIDGLAGARAPSSARGAASAGGDLRSPIGDIFSGGDGPLSKVFDIVGAGSFGRMLNEGLDSLGLPDWVGDVAGGALDFATGNFVGAAANTLDLAEDIAKACGGDELAGFLKAGAEITGMFSAGPLGAVGSLGKAGETMKTIAQVGDMIGQGQDVLEHAQQGDLLGAATGVFGMVATHAGLGVHLGMEPDQIDRLTDVATRGHELGSWLDHATEDGSLGVDDLLDAVGTHFGDDATKAAMGSLGALLRGLEDDPAAAALLAEALSTKTPEDTVSLPDILGSNLRMN